MVFKNQNSAMRQASFTHARQLSSSPHTGQFVNGGQQPPFSSSSFPASSSSSVFSATSPGFTISGEIVAYVTGVFFHILFVGWLLNVPATG